MSKLIFHIDVNSAYLSWESAYALSHGEKLDYRTIPSIVGGDKDKRHGIVLAKSMPAKNLGIKTAETILSAKTKCPDLKIIRPHFDRYIKASSSMIKLIFEYTDLIQRYSIDEVFADMTNYNGDCLTVAKEISQRIKTELGFTVNIGIGPNKLLAKMASDFEKPDKIHTLFKEELPYKFWNLDVSELYMVGRKTAEKLKSRGIKTIGELSKMDPEYMEKWMKKPGVMIWKYANGIEESEVIVEEDTKKSIGNSVTTPFDVDNEEDALRFIAGLCKKVGIRLKDAGKRAKVVNIAIKNSQFITKSHQEKLNSFTNDTNKIYKIARKLFKKIWKNETLRLFSVSVSELNEDDEFQLSLFKRENYNYNILDGFYYIKKV